MDLLGKKVLITGAGRRLGKTFALAIAEAGADVAIHFSSSEQSAKQVMQEIRMKGRQAYLVQGDLQDTQNVHHIIKEAFDKLAGLDALVNSAAIFEALDWKTTTVADWERHITINLTAPFFLSQTFAQLLPPEKQGKIVNILDWRALRPMSDHLPYTISKAALAALTKSLAVALAPSITVNGLALGAILPPSDGSNTQQIVNDIPAKRWAKLEEVTQTLIFLLRAPDYITGEIIHVDGGRHLI